MENILDENLDIVEETPLVEKPAKRKRRNSFNTRDSDPGFLVAKGRFFGKTKKQRDENQEIHIKKLGSAIVKSMEHNGYAKVRSVGKRAHLSALYAIENAVETCDERGIELFWSLKKDKGNIGELRNEKHVVDVEAFLFSLGTFNSKEGNR